MPIKKTKVSSLKKQIIKQTKKSTFTKPTIKKPSLKKNAGKPQFLKLGKSDDTAFKPKILPTNEQEILLKEKALPIEVQINIPIRKDNRIQTAEGWKRSQIKKHKFLHA